MTELLQQEGVREEVANMTPETLAWYKDLLVSEGIYVKYVKERKDKSKRKERITGAHRG